MLRRRLVSWPRQIRDRGPAAVARALRLGVAAVASYGLALPAVGDPKPVTAALTALLIVQVTLVGTLAETARRILAVLVGVGVAITVSALAGFTLWSLAGLVIGSILLGQALRLGAHLLEVPISAMLILAAGGAGVQATDRVVETLIGAAVGVLVNVVIPPSVRTRTAGEAVENFARKIAGLLGRVADTLAEGPVGRDQAYEWLREQRALAGDTVSVDRVLVETQLSRRLNPRAAGSLNPVPDLRSGLDALEHTAVALRSVLRSIADGAGGATSDADGREQDEPSERVRRGLAELLAALGRCVAAFGTAVRDGSNAETRGRQLRDALEAVHEARRELAELLLVDPREATALWQLHGSLLAGVDRALAELDVETLARGREQRRREAAEVRRATQAARRLRSSARRVVVDNPGLRHPRRR